MKVEFLSRPAQQNGGDTIHLRELRRSLVANAGIEAQAQEPQILHFFNLGRPQYLLPRLKRKPAPRVLISSLFAQYALADRLHSPLRAWLQKGLGPEAVEYLKSLARALRDGEKLPLYYWLHGHRAAIQRCLDHCHCLITATAAEYELIRRHYHYQGLHRVIPLGIEHLPMAAPRERQNEVLCVARFEPLKNQLNLIKACRSLGVRLHLVGEASAQHQAYFQACQAAAQGAEVKFYGAQSPEFVAGLMQAVAVHALVSTFESTGLASLEALASGCRIVVNEHPIQRELFGPRAHYAEPLSPAALQNALRAALQDSSDHRTWARENFSWQRAAQSTAEAYQSVLNLPPL